MSCRRYNISFLVLLYDKEINRSNTLNTLANSCFEFENCKLVIWNNGPKAINLEDYKVFVAQGFDVSVVDTLDNESLAVIYNKFVNLYHSDKYVLLDDDSELNDNYLKKVIEASDQHLTVPIISMSGKIQGPKVDGKLFDRGPGLDNAKNIMAIGSGLVLGNVFANKMIVHYGTLFDERFYLYGVDSTFFYRLNRLGLINCVTVVEGFNHSLSRLEKESSNITEFRKLERTYDMGLTTKYYSNSLLKLVYRVLRVNLSWVIKRSLGIPYPVSIKHFNYAAITGKHYRLSEKKHIVITDL